MTIHNNNKSGKWQRIKLFLTKTVMTSKNASKVTVQVIVSKCNFKDMLCKLPLQNFNLPVNKPEKRMNERKR